MSCDAPPALLRLPADSAALEAAADPAALLGKCPCVPWDFLGLKMSVTISPKMIRRRRKIHFRRPVFFWYLRKGAAARTTVAGCERKSKVSLCRN